MAISRDTKTFRFYIVPSSVVADYVKREHQHWLARDKTRRGSKLRTFRIGRADAEYPIPTPTIDKYEDNWDFGGTTGGSQKAVRHAFQSN